MFGARNGPTFPAKRNPSASHLASPLHDGNTHLLRRRQSSESISSAGSGAATIKPANTHAHLSKHHQAPEQPNHSMATKASGNQSHAPLANKELNIQVVVRIRNRNEREVRENSPVAVQSQNKEILVPSTLGDRAPSKTYSFDRVFMYSDQECIYNEVVTPILDEVLTGYNCTIFAYGQTGTGKTFTMEGDLRDNFGECSRDAGIIPRTLYSLFAALDRKETEYSVRVSFLELYNEEVKDLLTADEDRKAVKIFDSIKKQGPLVQGLEEVAVYSAAQGIESLRKGSAKRTVAATKSNDKSSRSHGIFSITVHVKETTDDGEELLKIGKLNLEAGRINQSLLTLGRVINSLVERSQHIPYRESKLTRLLEDSLGGKTKTCIIATISPARSCLEETISTLNYANRAKNIKNTPEINQKMSKKTLIKEYLLEIDRLKADLHATREKTGVFMTQESYQALLDENTSNKDLVAETQKQVDKITQELERVEEKFRENMKLLTAAEYQLAVSKAELETTKQTLQEETILRQAHAHTENELNTIAANLRSTLSTSLKDNRGLHDKLERKTAIERENQRALGEFQERLLTLSSDLGERVQGFGMRNESRLGEVSQRMDEAFKEAMEGARNTQSFLKAQLERMAQTVESLCAVKNKSSEEALSFKQEFEALRLETQEFLSTSTETTRSGAVRGFEALRNVLSEYTGLVERHHEEMMSGTLGLVDKSAEFTKDSTDRLEQSLASYEKSTHSEIEFLQRENQLLRQKLKEQEAIRSEQKGAVLAEIGGLLDGFLERQSSTLHGHFSDACTAIEGSTTRLNAVHLAQRTWATEFGQLGADHARQLAASRVTLEDDCHEAKTRMVTEGKSLATQVSALDSSIQNDLASQQTSLNARLSDWSAKSLAGYTQLQDQQESLAQMYTETSNNNIAALEDLQLRATSSRTSVEAAHSQLSINVTAVKNEMAAFDKDVHRNLELTREEMEGLLPRRIKVDDSTGRTPSRRRYKYPQSWGRTRPSKDLLREFRELGRVDIFTTEEPVEKEPSAEPTDSDDSSMAPPLLVRMPEPISSQSSAPEPMPSSNSEETTRGSNASDSGHEHAGMLSAVAQETARSRSPSAPTTRRLSQSAEVEQGKENTAEAKPVAVASSIPAAVTQTNGSVFSRYGRPGKFGMGNATATESGLGKRLPGFGVQSSGLLSNMTSASPVLSKRPASELDADGQGSNLTDISNNNVTKPKTTGIPMLSGASLHAAGSNALGSSLAPPSTGIFSSPSAFGGGKSGTTNGAEGPRKVMRPAPTKPQRRAFGNNRS
ncbi:kinesin motor protein cin8 [Mortierella alpina]|uniref:Kinesin motor protein cin8 n=1 Tax=Mortierella alpina TaxID=64518 RepID=A0A9P6IZ04_MORAP|nr:kinesin motor protein cin8 [Mortierella alpina]